MKKNHYESVVIINAALEDEQINSIITKVEDHLKTNGAEITDIDKWGRKRLAYPIQKSKSGYYVIFRFVCETNIISGLERMYRLDENIIRYLTIVLDARALENIELNKTQGDEDNSNSENSTPDKKVESTPEVSETKKDIEE